MKYVSDLIELEDIEQWKDNDAILIKSPTGSGKSHFIKNTLKNYCVNNGKTILLLTNRDILKEQNLKELVEDNVIDVKNYQQIEYAILNGKPINSYDIVVADEIHYFFLDSTFSRKTDISFNWLLNNNTLKILLSATCNIVEEYFSKNNIEVIKYEIESDYNYISDLYYYFKDDVLKKLISDIPDDEKIIYFAGAKKAYEMSNEFENSKFICSKHSSTYSEFSDDEEKNNIIENAKFDCRLLCCTSVLDNGINIKDKSVKHIIVDIFDLDTLQQCIGRKRVLDKDDTITIYIKDRKGRSINTRINFNNCKLSQAIYLEKHGEVEFLNEYKKETINEMIDVINNGKYNISLRLNHIMYFKYLYDNELCKFMLEEEYGFGYQDEIFKRFKIGDGAVMLEDLYDGITLEDKLNQLVGVKMFKEEQNNFKEFLMKELLNVPKGSHGKIGLKTINALFEDNKVNYRLTSDVENSRKSEYYKKTFWMVIKLIED